MKNLLKTIAFAIVMSTCYNCTVDSADTVQNNELLSQEVTNSDAPAIQCANQDPKAILTNNSLVPANLEVFDQFGLLMTHAYGVPAGDVSSDLTFPDGMTTFVVSTSTSTKEIKIDMGNCMIYEVEIDMNNQLDTDVPNQL
ncbi:hypothetical protein [Psychroserpens sp.]|uniref:hypothetical protein n=1 Tax=Psychroserpens sp. TaxID=2020870 RepID=UPI00385D73BC